MEHLRFIKISGFCGVLGVLIYLGLAICDQIIFPETRTTQEFLAMVGTSKYGSINMAMHFLFVATAMLWIIAFLGLKYLLAPVKPNLSVSLGTLFGIIACAIMVQMMIVQGSVMVSVGRIMLAATDDAQRQGIVTLYKEMRSIDYGMDLAFDSFFFISWIILGCNMLRHAKFGKVIGSIGILLFVLALILNVYAAPDPPSFDIGPIAVFWLLAVFINMIRLTIRPQEAFASEPYA